MKNIVIFFAIVYLFSFSSFIPPTIIPDEPELQNPTKIIKKYPP